MKFKDLTEKEKMGICFNCSSSYFENSAIKCREENPDLIYKNGKLVCNHSDICHNCVNRGACSTDCGGWDFIREKKC